MQLRDGRLSFSPSDLSAFLACPHLTSLELAVARGELEQPYRHNPHADLIRRKGDEHEARYLASLGDGVVRSATRARSAGRRPPPRPSRRCATGRRVIYQAAFVDGAWRGLADFLERQPDGCYEVVDTKLARHARAGARAPALLLHRAARAHPGALPDAMHVVNGLGERETFRPDDFLAYYRRLQQRFLDAVENGAPTYPYPVDHCSLCEFLARCQEQWERDDHLSLVAGIARTQVERLTAAGIATLEALGDAPRETRVPKLRRETLAKLRDAGGAPAPPAPHRRAQARCCSRSRPSAASRSCPSRRPGDIWLDLEGDPWYEPARGLEYLFGWVYLDDDGEPQYDCIWALDRDEERAGFERLIDLIARAPPPLPRRCTSTTTRRTSARRCSG